MTLGSIVAREMVVSRLLIAFRNPWSGSRKPWRVYAKFRSSQKRHAKIMKSAKSTKFNTPVASFPSSYALCLTVFGLVYVAKYPCVTLTSCLPLPPTSTAIPSCNEVSGQLSPVSKFRELASAIRMSQQLSLFEIQVLRKFSLKRSFRFLKCRCVLRLVLKQREFCDSFQQEFRLVSMPRVCERRFAWK